MPNPESLILFSVKLPLSVQALVALADAANRIARERDSQSIAESGGRIPRNLPQPYMYEEGGHLQFRLPCPE